MTSSQKVLPYHAVGFIVHHGKFRLPMSALGQKQTFAVQKGMSALPSKADKGGRGRMPLCAIIELSTCAPIKSY
jgi:hypothetical protein